MSYYDHAVAMACKLDRWSSERPLRNYEREALAMKNSETTPIKSRSVLKRWMVCLYSSGHAIDIQQDVLSHNTRVQQNCDDGSS